MINSRRTIWSNLPGGLPCHAPSARSSSCQTNCAPRLKPLPVPALHPRHWSSAAASSCTPPWQTTPPTRTSPPSSAAIATPWRIQRERFSVHGLEGLQDAPRSGRPRSFSPEERLSVITLASGKTCGTQQSQLLAWTWDELAFTLVNQKANQEHFLRHLEEVTQQAHLDYLRERTNEEALAAAREAGVRFMSRSTIQRILTQADLKPHKSVYWLNSHDPNFDSIARSFCRLYLDAPRLLKEEGRLVLSSDEKTGMQILNRNPPDAAKPATG